MNVTFICTVSFPIICCLLTLGTASPEFRLGGHNLGTQARKSSRAVRISGDVRTWTRNRNHRDGDRDGDGDGDQDEDDRPVEVEGRRLHKTKRLQRKIRRLCLLTGPRSVRSAVTSEGRFFFPTIVQQTGVNVDVGAAADDYDDPGSESESEPTPANTRIECADLLSAGFFNQLHPLPLLQLPASGGADTDADADADDDPKNKFYYRKFNRYIIRPLNRSLRKFYTMLRRR